MESSNDDATRPLDGKGYIYVALHPSLEEEKKNTAKGASLALITAILFLSFFLVCVSLTAVVYILPISRRTLFPALPLFNRPSFNGGTLIYGGKCYLITQWIRIFGCVG